MAKQEARNQIDIAINISDSSLAYLSIMWGIGCIGLVVYLTNPWRKANDNGS